MKTRFILINTSHAGNVGAAARAMKTMGFTDMVLVAPRWANVLRREETSEGVLYYRMRDLVLERDRSPALSRSWAVMHRIDASSPLYGATPETLARDEVEFRLTVVGIDETSAQSQHARFTYSDALVRWGARHEDMLSTRPGGGLRVDMGKFHGVTATLETPTFPYPRAPLRERS